MRHLGVLSTTIADFDPAAKFAAAFHFGNALAKHLPKNGHEQTHQNKLSQKKIGL